MKKSLRKQNANFSLVDNSFSIKKRLKYKLQRLKRGFDDTETWNLDITITKFILPRLKVFKETTIGHPSGITMEKWMEYLDDMIWAFQYVIDMDSNIEIKFNQAAYDKHRKGMNLFSKYFMHLWV